MAGTHSVPFSNDVNPCCLSGAGRWHRCCSDQSASADGRLPAPLDICQHMADNLSMSRPRHPDKEIEKAVRYAESLGWRVEISRGHAWGRLFCPLATPDGCIINVYSTPRSGQNHARHIVKDVDHCPHCQRQMSIDEAGE